MAYFLNQINFHRLCKALVTGLVVTFLGLIVSILPQGIAFEESLGLKVLFSLRGERPVPDEVLIVSMDQPDHGRAARGERLPRLLHAQLIDILRENNVKVVVFDITFSSPGKPNEDLLLKTSIQRAGNVILCDYLEVNSLSFDKNRHAHLEKLHPPIPVLAEAAVITAPFPLPKIPVRLNQFWAFKSGAGDKYTLPAAALQVYLLENIDEFSRQFALPISKTTLAAVHADRIDSEQLDRIIRQFREHFLKKRVMDVQQPSAENPSLNKLAGMYQGRDSRYLNFYGPPGTIKTISLNAILEWQENKKTREPPADFTNKAVFVGLSELNRVEQKDNFYTVFSQPDGRDLNGVEILATAFANLLEGNALSPPGRKGKVLLFAGWGLLTGSICSLLAPPLALLCLAVFCSFLLTISLYLFSSQGLWLPLATPLLVQAPAAFAGATLWNFYAINQERLNIKEAFEHYLPNNIVEKLSRRLIDIRNDRKIVHGTCLLFDIEDYTGISEKLGPDKLSSTMNQFYSSTFQPVHDHDGLISDNKGDSILAIWVDTAEDSSLRQKSCLAALDILQAAKEFQHDDPDIRLQIRIGIDSGHMCLGNIGAMQHYEYTPIGDVVNTASRLESLNKHLGTRIIVSEYCLNGIDAFLTRKLGTFLLMGKSQPITVFELMTTKKKATQKQMVLCDEFEKAHQLFQQKKWQRAARAFSLLQEKYPLDGPSNYYIKLCTAYILSPPQEPWDTGIKLETK